ncbi:MASE1 domain-containing protein [Xanthomonas vesicatoria]|uniref:MASE1 domain-containing protein n=2 Tax=Xanthomonas vesicatoria TaxID=56460 RepID=A0ABS8L4B3_9XANT|nr:MASE1 domain-containing protein [Xanthomonas vesicatoria]APO93366.1 histidine kinase [Xanthomonas vesicatoria]MCC8620579.1 MASE1 domain-containing protein [Xanthomonas vesicatoria]MDG4491602.1 histidine kinase [Xanthomonas vesicatoria]
MEGMRYATRGLLTATAYCLAFQLAWHCSLDQWYLPAGLRIAALLFAPYRMVPWVLLGDVGALLMLRVPAISGMGISPVWAYGSSCVLGSAISLVPMAIRIKLREVHRKEALLIPLLLLAALWSAVCTQCVNILLEGPATAIGGIKLVRFAVGDYLGMLMVILPVMLWLRRKETERPGRLAIHSAASSLTTALLFALATLPENHFARLGMMSLFIIPAILLTWLHGWRGAAIGLVIANAALGFSLRNTGAFGAYDSTGFVVQIMLATIATSVFVLGTRISSVLTETRIRLRGEQQAQQTARMSYMWAERELREHVIGFTDVQVHVNMLRRDIESHLKSRGQNEAAMRMIRTGSIQSRMLNEYINTLYPLEIETHGLYHVYCSAGFARVSHTEVSSSMLRGDPMALSVGLQLAVYRCTLSAVSSLPPGVRLVITARVGKTRDIQGIVVTVAADQAQYTPVDRATYENAAVLSRRVKTYGGALKHHHTKISFYLSEPLGSRLLFRYDDPVVIRQ